MARESCQSRAQVTGRASGVVLHAVVRRLNKMGRQMVSILVIYQALQLLYALCYNLLATFVQGLLQYDRI
jgi:hypothetical protein